MKMAGTGATFPSTPGAQRVLETSLASLTCSIFGWRYCTLHVSEETSGVFTTTADKLDAGLIMTVKFKNIYLIVVPKKPTEHKINFVYNVQICISKDLWIWVYSNFRLWPCLCPAGSEVSAAIKCRQGTERMRRVYLGLCTNVSEEHNAPSSGLKRWNTNPEDHYLHSSPDILLTF
jgi:hypothetical protein